MKTPMLDLAVPEKRCKKGHVIPRNGDVIDGKTIKRPRIACEVCARYESAGRITPPKKPRGKQEADPNQLTIDVPMVFIGRNG